MKEELFSQLHDPLSQTLWSYSWIWDAEADQDGKNCRAINEQVDYKADIKFPRWIPPKNASLDLTQNGRLLSKLLPSMKLSIYIFEHLHIIHGGKTLIQTAINGSDCNYANQKAYDALQCIRDDHNRYDKTTINGLTQGAIFPSLDSVSLNKLLEQINGSNVAPVPAISKKPASEICRAE